MAAETKTRGEAGLRSDVDVVIAILAGRKFSLFDLGEVFRRDIAVDLVVAS